MDNRKNTSIKEMFLLGRYPAHAVFPKVPRPGARIENIGRPTTVDFGRSCQETLRKPWGLVHLLKYLHPEEVNLVDIDSWDKHAKSMLSCFVQSFQRISVEPDVALTSGRGEI